MIAFDIMVGVIAHRIAEEGMRVERKRLRGRLDTTNRAYRLNKCAEMRTEARVCKADWRYVVNTGNGAAYSDRWIAENLARYKSALRQHHAYVRAARLAPKPRLP